jgi:hypothetical protein
MDINLILEIFAYVAMKYFEYSVVPMVWSVVDIYFNTNM